MNKIRKNHFIATIIAMITMGIAGGSALAGGFLDLEFLDADFTSVGHDPLIIDNEYWRLRPDDSFVRRTFTYVGATDDECVIDQIAVDDAYYGSTYIMIGDPPYGGLEVVQVVDTEWVFEGVEEDDCNTGLLDGSEEANAAIKELTLDWYLQDVQDNIWYMGELSQSFEDECPEFGSTDPVPDECFEGSWEAGVDGDPEPGPDAELFGQAGIVVPGDEPIAGEPLTPGTYYMQEVAYEAEDMAKILRLKASVSVEADDVNIAGDYENCRKVKEWNPQEHGESVEHKYYCAGPGLVLIEGVGGGPTEVEELVSIVPPL